MTVLALAWAPLTSNCNECTYRILQLASNTELTAGLHLSRCKANNNIMVDDLATE